MAKALRWPACPRRSVRAVAVDDRFRMTVDLSAPACATTAPRAFAVPRGGLRGHHEHGRPRSPGRAGRLLRGGEAVAPRGRRLRGLFPLPGGARRGSRASSARTPSPRSPQGAVPALRDGLPARAGRGHPPAPPTPRAPPTFRTSGRPGAAPSPADLARAVARLPRPARLAASHAPRSWRLSRGPRREAGAGAGLSRRARAPPRGSRSRSRSWTPLSSPS